jgi:Tfp pilus assembly protein PilO
MKINLEKLNYRYLFRTRRYLMITILLVVIDVTLILAAIVPFIQQTFTIRAKIASETSKLQELKKKQAALEQSETLQLVQLAPQIEQLLPSHKPLLELMTGLNTQAASTGVSFSSIKVNPGSISTASAAPAATGKPAAKPAGGAGANKKPAPVKQYDTLSIELLVEGSLSQINAFLTDVEKLAPLSNVTGISLSEIRVSRAQPADPNIAGSGLIFEAQLKITTYFFTRSVAAAVDTPLPTVSREDQPFLDQLTTFIYPKTGNATSIQGGGLDDLFGVEQIQ